MKFSELPITTMFRWRGGTWTKLSCDGEILSNDYKPLHKNDPGHQIGYCSQETMVEVITDTATIDKLNQSSCRCHRKKSLFR